MVKVDEKQAAGRQILRRERAEVALSYLIGSRYRDTCKGLKPVTVCHRRALDSVLLSLHGSSKAFN